MAAASAMAAVLVTGLDASAPMPCLVPGRPGCIWPGSNSGLRSKKWPMSRAMVRWSARRSRGVGAGRLFVDLRGVEVMG